MSDERALWAQVATRAGTAWHIDASEDVAGGFTNPTLRDYMVRVYAVDTSSDWLLAGATTLDGLRFARASVMRSAGDRPLDRVTSEAALRLHRVASAQASDAHVRLGALTTALESLVATKTYEAVCRDHSPPLGHWILILYRAKDNSLLTRPAFIGGLHRGYMEVGTLEGHLRTIMAADLGAAQSGLGQRLARSGGAVLADRFANLARQDDSPAPRRPGF